MRINHPVFPLIFSPWLAAEVFISQPEFSYLIAWLGSFFIFYITLFSRFSPSSTIGISPEEIMRPIALIQIIFAGFMCCTSIFYFIAHINEDLEAVATCQRLALLAHASLVSGILLMMKRTVPITKPKPELLEKVVIKICIISALTSFSLNYIPLLIQFKYPLMALSATSGAYLFVTGIYNRSLLSIVAGIPVLLFNFTSATLTGFKEGIIVQFVTLIFITYPYYKKTIILLGIPCGYILLYVLPTYTTLIREKSWTGSESREIARQQAYQTFFDDSNDKLIMETNWKFLTDRSSEIGMFILYIKRVPEFQDYYGLQILGDSFLALIPKAIWLDKPSTEVLAMQRVYSAGVANRASSISAKTRPIVDGYLMFGAVGIFALMFLYGTITQWICNQAEKLFGGYELGCIIIFNSLFQQLWRGNNLEFLMNNVFYAYLLTLVIFTLMKFNNLKTLL